MVRLDRVIPNVLADVIRKAPLCPEKVAFAWAEAVGPALQRATTIRLDDKGVLHVTSAEAQWAREVKRSAGMIRARMERLLGPGVVVAIAAGRGGSSDPPARTDRSRRRR